MGLRAPRVAVSPAVAGPLLIGVFRPAILLPRAHPALADRQVFVHELAHLRRRDCLWNLLCRLLGALYYFQPLIPRLAREMEQTSEEACDDVVVSLLGGPRAYACRLLDIARMRTAVPPQRMAIGLVNLRSSLGLRIQRMANSAACHAAHLGGAEILCLALLASLAVFLVGSLKIHAAVPAPEQGGLAPRLLAAQAAEPDLPSLIRALRSPDWRRREQAAISLAQTPGVRTVALPALADALRDEEWRVRKAAAVALITTGQEGRDAVDALIAALDDDEWQVRRPAAEALAAVGPLAEPAVPALSDALADDEWHVRRAAATALVAIGSASRPAVPQLLRTLDDDQWHVRESAALALGVIGPGAVQAIPALIDCLDDPEWRVRRAAAGALENIAAGNRAAIPEVIHALRDPEWLRRQAAARSLEKVLRK